MSLDQSLKVKGALIRHRNVLTRAERIKRLADEEQSDAIDSPFSLPKVANRKGHSGRKEKPAPGAEAAVAEEITPES